MRRTVLLAIAALAAIAAVPVTAAVPVQTTRTVNAHVSPGTGGPRTKFTLTFRNPVQTGELASMQRAETVDLHGNDRPGCVWSGQMAVPAAAAQQLVQVSLTPSHMSTGAETWCTGTFRGSIVETEHVTCAPPHLCPMIAIRPQTITRFTFKVKRRP